MTDEFLKITDIEQHVFDNALNLIFGIINDMYEKGGMAFVKPDRDPSDLSSRYVNTAIEIFQCAPLCEITKSMLESAYVKIVKECNPAAEQLYELTILKQLLPCIQDQRFESIIEYQDYFCSQETIIKNHKIVEKYSLISPS